MDRKTLIALLALEIREQKPELRAIDAFCIALELIDA